MARFSGKSIIITGSSSGIGRSAAVIFAKEGAQVTITGRSADRLEETRLQILKAGVPAEKINAVVADVCEASGQDEVIRTTLAKFGKIDILVNNAGALLTDGTSNTDQAVELYQKTFKLNFQAVVEMTQKTKEYLIKTKGEIVNVSSIVAGPQAQPASPYYACAKAALDQYTRCTAIDLIQHGVRVNSVSPGVIATGFLGAMGLPETASDKFYNFMGSQKECIPVGHCGKPEEIANIIVFLADRRLSSYIIGQSIVADGGSTLVMGMQTHDLMSILNQ
ncbi:DeHydrogenases, Short chain [Caenorhabditis elegans]|uniref:DeHydrogenases, Short chain n=1 Tax=Caenorhabditis elegans TaxID=6239 RepID=O45709_CAEEL|nr:DeHydrogenases, Short chain [Caenorhabditis elegans]CAB04628.1 DeHydrogenases, Short chain [Caenorhabditis elegans]|eukprot:NP_506820.1 DeHydrogenases, Short chain [Caenorhabditis elegans]